MKCDFDKKDLTNLSIKVCEGMRNCVNQPFDAESAACQECLEDAMPAQKDSMTMQMPNLARKETTKITFEDGSLPELKDKVVKPGILYAATGLSEGMQSGKPSVALTIETEDGNYVFVQTSLLMFQTIARAFKAKYGEIE